MSNLPCERLDHIVGLLHDGQTSLMNCCLVSKSWVPRIRRHLFADIHLLSGKSQRLWKKTFRDPSTSPACYTKTLLVGSSKTLTDADAEGNGWIGDFSRVVHFTTVGPDAVSFKKGTVLFPFHGFSPFLKSLRVHRATFSSSQLFDPILSFPLLEDLSITDCYCDVGDSGDSDEVSTTIQPSSSPVFTGSLELSLRGATRAVHWLLSLPGGIHFRKLTLRWSCEEDISLGAALVEKCSHILESLDIACNSTCGTSIKHLCPRGRGLPLFAVDLMSVPFDLSQATKLEYVGFRPVSLRIGWITRALRAITDEHQALRRILVVLDVPIFWNSPHIRKTEGLFEQWLDLDRILVHLLDSFSIRANVRWVVGKSIGIVADSVEDFLPEMTRRGMVTLDQV